MNQAELKEILEDQLKDLYSAEKQLAQVVGGKK